MNLQRIIPDFIKSLPKFLWFSKQIWNPIRVKPDDSLFAYLIFTSLYDFFPIRSTKDL